jgi:hypothetical protein
MNPKEIFQTAQSVCIVVPDHAPAHDLQTAFTLFCTLKKLGKNVVLEGNTSMPFITPASKEKTFVVTLKGLAPWISRVRYEKSDNDLKLYFALHQGELSFSNFSLERQGAADVSLIVGEKESLHNAQEMHDLALSRLPHRERSVMQLVGRALLHLEHLPKPDVYLSLLSAQDFAQTTATNKEVHLVVSNLKEHLGITRSIAVLFETSNATQGLVWSERPELKQRIAQTMHGQEKGNWVLLSQETSLPQTKELFTKILTL